MLRQAILLVGLAAGHTLGFSEAENQIDIEVSSKGYIIEYVSGLAKRDEVFSALNDVRVTRQYESSIFNGASIETEAYNADDLLGLPEVARVWPNQYYNIAAYKSTRQSSGLDPADYDVHNATGVRELHEMGIRGKGAKVAVVDTGVDYNHPAFGSGFGEGFKVAGGYDLVGDGTWPQIGSDREPDEDPMDYSGHGTHVAGIVVGETDNWSGVAPEATLYAYKTFSIASYGTNDAVNIEAFLQAYEEGCDIISASIGGPNGWSTGAWAEVSSRLVDEGIVVVIAAANYGANGPFYSSTGSSGKNVLAAADIIVNQAQGTVLPQPGSAWGPLYDLQVKPDVGAPGTDIYSAWLDNEFEILTGTSMATPYMAGMAALFISANGGRDVYGKDFAHFFRRRLIATSDPVPHNIDTDAIASVAQVGAGLANVAKAVAATTNLEFNMMALNDTHYFSRYHSVTVANQGEEDVEYSFSKDDAVCIKTVRINPDGTKVIPVASELETTECSVIANLPNKFTLRAGAKKTVQINFGNPDGSGWDATEVPLYSGQVKIEGSNGEELKVPFLGVGADIRRELNPLWVRKPYLVSMDPPIDFGNKSSFSFNLTAQDFPKIFSTPLYGTKELRWDIFEKGWTERKWSWPLVPGKNGYVGSATSWVGSGQTPGWFEGYGWNPDETYSWPLYDRPRVPSTSLTESWWFGKLANGTKIANGDYVLRFALLKPFGRRESADNWAVFNGPFTVTGQYESEE